MKPLILVTNDDGITSPGIRHVVEIAKEFGNVVVVAPDSPQSAMGHAITISNPIRLNRSHIFDDEQIDAYECSGTPADCVKLAKNFVMKDKAPDLVLSGMNHGSNTSISVLYSGTMSAAIEAAMSGRPAIGFSLCEWDHEAELEHTSDLIREIIKQAFQNGIPKGTALNVNFPAAQSEAIQGVKICRQGSARWDEKFDNRKDPMGKPYFWMAGDFINLEDDTATDEWAINNNFASLVPCQYDLTSYDAIRSISDGWNVG